MWFTGAGRSLPASPFTTWQRHRGDVLLSWNKGPMTSQHLLGGDDTLLSLLVRKPAHGGMYFARPGRHSVTGGGDGVTLRQGMNGIFIGNAGGQGSMGGRGRSGIWKPIISSIKPIGCRRTSPLADGAGAGAALAAPPSRAAADGGSIGATTAKATSSATSVHLLDGAIALCWMEAQNEALVGCLRGMNTVGDETTNL
jgi:hypothetical protein